MAHRVALYSRAQERLRMTASPLRNDDKHSLFTSRYTNDLCALPVELPRRVIALRGRNTVGKDISHNTWRRDLKDRPEEKKKILRQQTTKNELRAVVRWLQRSAPISYVS